MVNGHQFLSILHLCVPRKICSGGKWEEGDRPLGIIIIGRAEHRPGSAEAQRNEVELELRKERALILPGAAR